MLSGRSGIDRFPSGFRRRLALIFVAVAGVAAGALAIGASTAVSSYRHHTFGERAHAEAMRDIRLLGRESPAESLVTRLQPSEQPGGPDVLVVEDGRETSSVETLGLADVSSPLRRELGEAGGDLVEGTESISGTTFLVLGQRLRQGADAYFFFSQEELLRGLEELRVTLLVGWVLIVLAAAVVGTLVARRTLRPVQEAADAARAVTEGLLDTRLSFGGNDEFGQWALSFNEMVAALEEKLVALEEARDREERFNADIAHELRTPLGALLTAATLIEAHQADLPPHLQRPVALTVSGARRLHRLVDELLELHRLEAGQEVVEGDEVDVVEAVAAAVAAHGWSERTRIVAIGEAMVLTDRRRLDRIVANLVGNGLDHGGGEVTITITPEVTAVAVEVSDRGPGIEPQHLPHLFDRYFKVSRSRTVPASGSRSTGGSGLGLAIASEHAGVLGGTLTVDSEPGRGTAFTLRLPLLHANP